MAERDRRTERLFRIGWAVLALPVVLLIAAGLVALVVTTLGGDPGRALAAIYAGSVSNPASLAESLIKATPLLFTGLSVAVAFQGGIWNIGAEGQFLVGMLGSALVALSLPTLPPPLGALLALAAGSAAGALWALLPAILKVRREVPEVISTIMLNFLAAYLVEYLVRGPMKDPTTASDWSPMLPAATYLPRLGRLHLGVLLGLLLPFLIWLWMSRTGGGFRVRVVGANPAAAAAAGIRVPATLMTAFLVSGALAGLGGAVEILGLIQRLYRYAPGSPGYGFSGIAVALLGQLHPMGVLLSALFFGGLAAGCGQMQRSAGVSFHVAYVIQAALVLLLISLPRTPWRRVVRQRAAPDPGVTGTGS